MKRTLSIFFALFIFASCQKNKDILQPSSSTQSSGVSAKGGTGGGGGGATTGLISSIGGAFRLIGGNSDSIQVNFTQPAPATGLIVNLTSSDPSVQLPATFTVPAGEYIIHPQLTSS